MFNALVCFAFVAVASSLLVEYNSMLQKSLRELFPVARDPTIKSQGKILVVGGSPEHSSEPYFSAIAALRVGAVGVKVLTNKDNVAAINAYGPDVPVSGDLSDFNEKIFNYVQECDVILWGPGVGKDNFTTNALVKVLKIAKDLKKPIVIDHGGVDIIIERPDLLKGFQYPGVILIIEESQIAKLKRTYGVKKNTTDLEFGKLGKHVTIMSKGIIDTFVCYNKTVVWRTVGGHGPKRVEGQDRLLSGTLASLFNWALQKYGSIDDGIFSSFVATYGASRFSRDYSRRAFEDKSWSVVTSDLVEYIGKSIRSHILF